MDNEEQFFSESKKKVEQYIYDRVLLIKLQVVEKISRIVAKFFSALIIALLAFFVLLFISLVAAYFFAELTGSFYIGFGIVAAFYIILFVVVLMTRKGLVEKKITDEIIETIFDKTDEQL